MRAPHDLVWRLSLTGKCSLFRVDLCLRRFGMRGPRPSLELLEFLELAKEDIINLGWVSGKCLLSTRRNFEMTSSCVLDEARLCQIGFGPMYTVSEDCLFA